MRYLSEPPSTISLPISSRKTASGAWREWSSSASVCASFRRSFRDWAAINQDGRCAFCSLPVGISVRRRITIDHFIPKAPTGDYAEWTYEPLNLFIACDVCNSTLKQAVAEVQTPTDPDYASCTFTMFHPYLHKPTTKHFSGGYPSAGSRPKPIEAHSPEAKRAVILFDLSNPSLYATWRADYREVRRVRRQSTLPLRVLKLLTGAKREVN